jgi:hypothetical protein
MPPLMLLPYLESLRNLQGHHSGMQGFSANPLGSPQSVSNSPFTGIHPALSQLTPNFLGSSSGPTACSSTVTTKSSSSAPITSMVNFYSTYCLLFLFCQSHRFFIVICRLQVGVHHHLLDRNFCRLP